MIQQWAYKVSLCKKNLAVATGPISLPFLSKFLSPTDHSPAQQAAHLDRSQAALIEWYVPRDQAAQAVYDGTVGHRRRGVEVAVHLRPSACEVKGG